MEKKIFEPSKNENYYPLPGYEKSNTINIYKASLNLKSQIFIAANQPKNWFLYNVGYTPEWSAFDSYSKSNLFDKILDSLAHLIVWISLILAILSPLYLIYLLQKK